MKDKAKKMRSKRILITGVLATVLIAVVATLAIPSSSASQLATDLATSNRAELLAPTVANPAPPADACQSMQILVLLDRSGSVTNEGTEVVQQYKDQVKKIWHTLHNISKTYGGFSSGYLWAFAGRTSDQMPQLLAKDNNKDGVVNEDDRNLNNVDVLSGFDKMTQDIYFKSGNGPMYPASQTAAYGYNPKNEDTKYFTKAIYTNWHESFLMAQETVAAANAPGNPARDYSMILIVTDGEPTVDDGANHKWDIFKKNANIDENFDGNANTSSHATRTRQVVDALRSGYKVNNATSTFTPVAVQGVLIGGGTKGATRMTNTYGAGNWFQSSDFDSTLGAQLLNAVGQTCPPEPSLVGALSAEIINAPSEVIEDSDITYTVDVTNTGTALLEDISVVNGVAIEIPTDSTYTTEGFLAPGKKRRFSVTVHVGGGSKTTTVTLPYSAHVAEDPSLMAPGSAMDISGTLSSGLGVHLVPRPS